MAIEFSSTRKPVKLERGDIVIFYYPAAETRSYIKRIVGLPGETVEVRDGNVIINGKVLAEPYVEAKNNLALFSRKEVKVPEDSYLSWETIGTIRMIPGCGERCTVSSFMGSIRANISPIEAPFSNHRAANKRYVLSSDPVISL